MSTAAQLDSRILAHIDSGGRSEPFDALAMDLFAWQYANGAFYRALCDDLGRVPGRVKSVDDIPAAWPPAWRMAEVRCFVPSNAVAVFLSSGTTAAAELDPGSHGRSRHWFNSATLDLYRAALAGPFARALLPPDADRAPILVLMPPPQQAADSSLSFMMGEAVERFGVPGASGFFVNDGRLLADDFAAAAADLEGPAVVASTALGWVMLLQSLAGRRLPLPPGSRVMETGGYKGRSEAWDRDRLVGALCDTFNVPADAVVSEYGMCELSSQFYRTGDAGFAPQPWTRVTAIDPQTLRPVPAGEPGLLRIVDLANRGSCIAVQTEDLGAICADGTFDLLGRAPTAAAKGCSLTAEDLLGGTP